MNCPKCGLLMSKTKYTDGSVLFRCSTCDHTEAFKEDPEKGK